MSKDAGPSDLPPSPSARRSFRLVVALCVPSYFAFLVQIGSTILDKRVGALDQYWFLYPIRLLVILLYFAGSLGAYVLVPIAATIIYRRLWKDPANAGLAGVATFWLVGAGIAALFVLMNQKWG